jgi:LPXTG-motif cell wall-anchored protein
MNNFIGFAKSPLMVQGKQIATDAVNNAGVVIVDKAKQAYETGKNVVSAFSAPGSSPATTPTYTATKTTITAGNKNNKMLLLGAGALVAGSLIYLITKKSKK